MIGRMLTSAPAILEPTLPVAALVRFAFLNAKRAGVDFGWWGIERASLGGLGSKVRKLAKQHGQIQRLLHERFCAIGCLLWAMLRTSGHDDNGKIRANPFEFVERIPAAFFTQIEVEQDDIDVRFAKLSQSVVPIGNGDYSKIFEGQYLFQ